VDTPPPEPAVEAAPPSEDDDVPSEELVVQAPKPITAASALIASAKDVELRPLTRAGDVAELMPGLFAVQHAGGGKANQFFIRGFDADHGTDLALGVDGVPVNMVSHAHGQGYADLHFLIPETVASVEVRKGPYEVFDGDLATAGAVDMHLIGRLPESSVTAAYGMFHTWRGLALLGSNKGQSHAVLAAEAYGTDGPFDNPEDLTRFNGYAKVSTTVADTARISLAGSAYGGGWSASGQIPLRAVDDGSLSYWGSEDTSDGGQSTRRQAWATFDVGNEKSKFGARAWYGSYALNIYSNFTFFADDPVDGDQIEQQDRRTFGGYDAAWTTRLSAGKVDFTTRVGAQGRSDTIDTLLLHDKARERLSTTVDAAIVEARNGAYVREEVAFGRWVRFIGGARFDHYTFAVDDALDVEGDGIATSGSRDASLVSPKANLVIAPAPWLDVFLNFGRGFHSNDARGVVRANDPVTPLTAATGYECGVRLKSDRWGQVALVAWGLDMDEETVWVGDAGTTELRGATHRQGLDGMVRGSIVDWLHLDLDVTVAKAVYSSNAGNGDAVALAPTFTLAGGVEVDHPSGMSGGARVRHIGDRPATEDGSLIAEGWTVVDAEAGFRWRFVQLRVQVNNVLGTEWKEVQFSNESRLADEAEPVEDIHFTPGWPRTVLASLTFYR
jgi:outer membrane receptor protein involved in Fe transport